MSKDLNILQINLNRSPIATEAALELALELKIGLVLIQEPFIITTSTSNNNNPSYRSINHTVESIQRCSQCWMQRTRD
jgi:hypothetical protein